MSRYVFPDTELVPINATLRYAEEAGFEVRDVESLREHYALTLITGPAVWNFVATRRYES
jgi:cyclopropane-fatty-acyl-phospholipid synthase